MVIPDVPQWVQDEMARQQYKAQLALRVRQANSSFSTFSSLGKVMVNGSRKIMLFLMKKTVVKNHVGPRQNRIHDLPFTWRMVLPSSLSVGDWWQIL